MPKDTSSTSGGTDSVAAKQSKPAKMPSTLSELWTKKTTSTSTKATKVDAAVSDAEKAEPTPGPSTSSPSKRELSQMTVVTNAILDNLETDTMGESWLKVLQPEFSKAYFVQLKKFLLTEYTSKEGVFPKIDDVYSWSRFTSLDNVRVVILGQDPYHDVNQAHGLSFSVLAPTKPPASLKNIYKQLEMDIPGFKAPKTGDLSPIAKQGVLWLNSSLTVRAHKAGSHSKKGWETFTAQVLRAVLKREGNGVVLMAWGLPAQKTLAAAGINESKHLLLKSAHPSPLSAHKGFLGNEHFKKANDWLVKRYGEEAAIDWKVLCSPSPM